MRGKGGESAAASTGRPNAVALCCRSSPYNKNRCCGTSRLLPEGELLAADGACVEGQRGQPLNGHPKSLWS